MNETSQAWNDNPFQMYELLQLYKSHDCEAGPYCSILEDWGKILVQLGSGPHCGAIVIV